MEGARGISCETPAQIVSGGQRLFGRSSPRGGRCEGTTAWRESPTALRIYDSESAGLMHFFSDDAYDEICRVLKTPVEIMDYLGFRVAMVAANPHGECGRVRARTHWTVLADEGGAPPSMRFEAVFGAWRDEASA